jgi:hypothetical protein
MEDHYFAIENEDDCDRAENAEGEQLPKGRLVEVDVPLCESSFFFAMADQV